MGGYPAEILIRKAAWTLREPGLQSSWEDQDSQQRESGPRESHSLCIRIKTGKQTFSFQIEFLNCRSQFLVIKKNNLQASDKFKYGGKKRKETQPIVSIVKFVQMLLISWSDLTAIHSLKCMKILLGGRGWVGGWGRKSSSRDSAALDLQAGCFSQQRFYTLESSAKL